jgi:hypothetical protein
MTSSMTSHSVAQFPSASTSPPVPTLRAKSARPSMSMDDSTHQLIPSGYHHQPDSQNKEDEEEIIEEIQHVFDEIDIQSFDDESPVVHHSP